MSVLIALYFGGTALVTLVLLADCLVRFAHAWAAVR